MNKFGHSHLTISSSCGDVAIDIDGYPVSRLPPEYKDIVRFDLTRLNKMCLANHIPLRNDWDILAVGYWLTDGSYEQPAEDYNETGLMRHIWNGSVDEYHEAYEME